jgi:hypothetical protein
MELRQRCPQAAEQERHQPLRQASGQQRVAGIGVCPFAGQIADLTAGDHLQHIGAGNRVGHGAEHEMQAPDDLRFRNIRQGAEQRQLVAIDHFGILAGEKGADELGRLGQGAAEQAQEGHAAQRRIFTHAQQGAKKGFENLRRLQRRAGGLFLESVEGLQALVIEPGQAAPEHLAQQRLLRPEMVIDRRQVDFRGAGDHPHRRPLVTVFHEQAFGDVENAFAGIESGFLIGHEIDGPRESRGVRKQ